MQRRQFVQFAIQCAAVSSVVSSDRTLLRAQDESQRVDWEVGRHIYKSLKWNMVQTGGTVLDKFQLLKRLGYDGVELDSPQGLEQEEAIRASQKSGLPIEGIVNSTHWKVRHSDPDPGVREQALSNMQTAMHFAKAVGADSVLLVPGNVTNAETENHDQVWQRSTEGIRQLLPLAEALGVQILIENVGNGFCETPELFAEYVDQFDHPLLGIHFDIGNFIRLGPPAEWIRILGNRIKKLDVKDRTRANERKLIGDGQADWPAVRQALSDIGYQGWAAAEVAGGDETRLREVLTRMDRVLGKSDGQAPVRS
ncbi:MAG: sugar phosphate isomerase/epimerase [bacterium]|nr:sugar phosphate isomerase/epimerase [bacterium]